jgi:hypothetical protein
VLTQCIHPLVCITSTSILASLRCTCFDIARQISQLIVDIQGKPHHRPHRTLRATDRNTREQEECALAALAQLIPTHITRPHINSIDRLSLLAARMSQIAATTTLTSTSSLGQALGAGVPTGGSASANTIRNLLGGGGRFGGGPPPDGGQPPDGDPSDPLNPGAGGGGNPANPGGGRDPANGQLSDKLLGREPEIFDGDQAKVKNFLTEWNIYQVLNDQTWIMATPLE